MKLVTPRLRPKGMTNGVERYSSLWMNIANVSAMESTANRRKVGCAIVTESMAVFTGYNGVAKSENGDGRDNACEGADGLTKQEVIHAESNALDKMLMEGVSTRNAVAYVTLSPCVECAKRLANVGIRAVFYKELYRCREGVAYLEARGVVVKAWDDLVGCVE